jgi:hypothetical protein
MCSLVLPSTRWKSMCSTSLLVGVELHVAQHDLGHLPFSSMSRTLEWKASFLRACHRAL